MKELKAAIAHNVFIVNNFIKLAKAATSAELHNKAVELKEHLAHAHVMYGDISQYFPVDKSLENVTDADFARLSEIFDSIIATKEAITRSVMLLSMKSNDANEVQSELDALSKYASNLRTQVQALDYKFNRVDFSQYHPIREAFVDVSARA